MRSFLRYLRYQGLIEVDLARVVPSVAKWSLSDLPKHVSASAVQRVLDGCDLETPTGRRDHAILLLLARLGLRAGEVVRLKLEDIDWDNALITICGKGGHRTQLPLPMDVGQAIASYLHRDRPRCSSRSLFIRAYAPLAGLGSANAITTKLAVEFATQREYQKPVTWARQLGIVRGFALYQAGADPTTEVPPQGVLPFRNKRAKPYIYTEEEIRRLLKAALNLVTPHKLQPWTYYCLFGLLAVSGMRLGEALDLKSHDVDWSESLLTIRNAKFGKSRLVPLHPSTRDVLLDYAERRDQTYAPRQASYFFISSRGTRLEATNVSKIFRQLCR